MYDSKKITHPERATILVVDDEPMVINLLSQDLEEHGYSCLTAFTGDAALARLTKSHVDVMLLDLRLPGMSGMDVLKKVTITYPPLQSSY